MEAGGVAGRYAEGPGRGDCGRGLRVSRGGAGVCGTARLAGSWARGRRGSPDRPGRAVLAWRTIGGLSGLPFPRVLPRCAGLHGQLGGQGSGLWSLRSPLVLWRFGAEVVAQRAMPVGDGGVEDGDEEPPVGETGGHRVSAGHGQSRSGLGPRPYLPRASAPPVWRWIFPVFVRLVRALLRVDPVARVRREI